MVLADDHAVVRSALRALLEAEEGFEVVGEAEDVPSAVRDVETLGPDVLLLDLNMPGGSAIEALRQLTAAHPRTRIVVLTMESSPLIARQALAAGCSGYVLKQAAERELVQAVRLVAAGGSHLPAGQDSAQAGDGAAPDGLTGREAEVLGLIALGHTSREIADQLGLSARTVESHRSHIQQKLRLEGRPELVRYALDHGLIPGTD
jgi:two-component system response regulator NreC